MGHTLQQRVLAHVDQDAIVELASALIRIPSFKTEETPVARFLADFFRPRGYQVELQEIEPGRFQTIATLQGSGGGAPIGCAPHRGSGGRLRGGRDAGGRRDERPAAAWLADGHGGGGGTVR